jgi:lipopolysaccharide export system permease protein
MRSPIKTIDKLILKSYLGPMVASFFIVLFVLMMNFLWKYIEDLVGKGLSLWTIIEFIFYGTTFMIAMGFPLATLFAAIMTMGNLGENYELLALKSAGVSLPRIMFSLFIVTIGMATASFFVSNNLVPYSNKKIFALMSDVKEQKQKIEFKDGQFFNGVDNMSIRVEHQDPVTGQLRGVLIYSTSSGSSGEMSATIADSGYIRLSDDRRFLDVELFGGENYQFTRGRGWYEENSLTETSFDRQRNLELTPGYDFSRSDESAIGSNDSRTKTVAQLRTDIDSLNREVNVATTTTYRPLLYEQLFMRDTMVVTGSAEASRSLAERRQTMLLDSLVNLPDTEKERIYSNAQVAASNSANLTWNESDAKYALSLLYRAQIEWHKKWSLPVAVIVFFLIGAPLGAIIRKGGLGMPIIISVAFFVLYYVISIMGDKLAKEGTWPAFWGGWIPTLVLLPVALYLTYKATNDSGLLNTEWYIIKYQKFKKRYVDSRRKVAK